jgi:hypothetical protein
MLLFMCQNEPGACDEWDAELGGNCVIVFPGTGEMVSLEAPSSGRACRSVVHGANVTEVADASYEEAREQWASKGTGRTVLGQLLGEPDWIQGDETPNCNSCAEPMRFVAQLEEGPDLAPGHDTSMNFGGGCAYVFECECDSLHGKMLWQQ